MQVNVTPATTRDAPQNHHPAPLHNAGAQSRPQDLFYPPVDNANKQFIPDLSHLLGIATDLSDAGEAQQTAAAPDAAGLSPGLNMADQFTQRCCAFMESLPEHARTHALTMLICI